MEVNAQVVDDVITSILHEALYDPAKAHEYYERTKELQGRQKKEKKLTEEQKSNIKYSNETVAKASKAAGEEAAKKHAENIERIRGLVTARRQQLTDELRGVMEKLTKDFELQRTLIAMDKTKQLDAIQAKTQAQLAAVPTVPKGLSKERTAELAAKRKEQIDKILGDSRTESGAVAVAFAQKADAQAEEAQRVKGFASSVQKAKLGEVAAQLTKSLDEAKTSYQSATKEIKAKYEQAKETGRSTAISRKL